MADACKDTASKNDGKENEDEDSLDNKPYWGDLVVAAAFTAVTPVDLWKAAKTCSEEGPETCRIAILSVTFCAMLGGLSWLAYLRHSYGLSFAAFLSGLLLCSFNNINEWPYPEECVITPQFQGLLAGGLANGELTVPNHVLRMVLLFGLASYVSIQSPYSIYQEDVLPLLGGPVVLSIAFLAVTRLDFDIFAGRINWNLWTVQGARCVLAGIFMYHTGRDLVAMTNEEIPSDEDGSIHQAQDKLMTIVKASIVAIVGLVATGTFQSEIDQNERLEIQVKKRTKEIQEKNDRLQMVELALRASETAIAITDSDRKIIWLNSACEGITLAKLSEEGKKQQQQNQSFLGKPIVEVLALETMLDEKTLTFAFSKSRQEDEICIDGMIFHLEVSPYEYSFPNPNDREISGDNGRFLVVLKNITAERARDVAEKTARDEAMMAKAMGDSMVTLTVSCY